MLSSNQKDRVALTKSTFHNYLVMSNKGRKNKEHLDFRVYRVTGNCLLSTSCSCSRWQQERIVTEYASLEIKTLPDHTNPKTKL